MARNALVQVHHDDTRHHRHFARIGRGARGRLGGCRGSPSCGGGGGHGHGRSGGGIKGEESGAAQGARDCVGFVNELGGAQQGAGTRAPLAVLGGRRAEGWRVWRCNQKGREGERDRKWSLNDPPKIGPQKDAGMRAIGTIQHETCRQPMHRRMSEQTRAAADASPLATASSAAIRSHSLSAPSCAGGGSGRAGFAWRRATLRPRMRRSPGTSGCGTPAGTGEPFTKTRALANGIWGGAQEEARGRARKERGAWSNNVARALPH